MYLFGPITSGLSERYGCKVVAFLGGLLCFLGLLLTSFVSDLSKLYLTYGVLWGIGSSFCYFPTLTVPGEYFCQRLSLVNGIVTAGKLFVDVKLQITHAPSKTTSNHLLNFGPKLLPFGNKRFTLVMTGRSGIQGRKINFL